MFITNDLETQIMREIDSISALNKIKSINLGGIAGVSGGQGTAPGGFIGQLAQKYVTFDTQELTGSGIGSKPSLVENLNRIRGGWALGDGSITSRHLASGISIPTITTITVADEDTTLPNISKVKFTNSNGVTLTSPNEATVAIPTIITTNNIYSIPSGVGTRFSTYSWFIDGYLASGISTEDIYKFIDPYILYGITLTTQNPGSIDSKFNIQSSIDGSAWNTLFTPDFSIESGIYTKHYSFNQITLESGILLRNLITTAGNLNGITITLEGITNIISITSGGGGVLGNLSPNKVVITDSNGIATTSENIDYNENLIINEVSIIKSPTIKFNRTYGSGTAPISNTTLSSLNAGGFNGTGMAESKGNIRIVTSEDWTENNNGTKLIVDLTPGSGISTDECMILTGEGDLSITGDLFAKKALITELYVGAENINTSLSGRTRNLTVINDVNVDQNTSSLTSATFSNIDVPTSTLTSLHARGDRLNPSQTLANDVVARITGRGYWGGINNDYAQSPRGLIDFVAEQDYTQTAQGVRLEFFTTPPGSDVTSKNLTVWGDGVVEVNNLRLSKSPSIGQAVVSSSTSGDLEFIDFPSSNGHVIQGEGTDYPNKPKLNFVGAGVSVSDGGGGDATIITITGGVVTPDSTIWQPLASPNAVNDLDDEFNDATFDSVRWTTYEPTSGLSVNEDVVGLKLTATSYNEVATIAQPVPTDNDYTVWTRLSLYGGTYDGWGRCGIIFQEGDETQKMYTVGPQITGSNDHGILAINSKYWTDGTTLATDGSWEKYYPMSLWIRVRVIITSVGDADVYTCYTDLSTDGISWQYCGSDILDFIPDNVGLFILQADQQDTALFSFFRVTNTSDINQIMGGNRIGVTNA